MKKGVIELLSQIFPVWDFGNILSTITAMSNSFPAASLHLAPRKGTLRILQTFSCQKEKQEFFNLNKFMHYCITTEKMIKKFQVAFLSGKKRLVF